MESRFKKIFWVGLTLLCFLPGVHEARAQVFDGHYDVREGVNPDGTTYKGHVIIDEVGPDVYQVEWKFPGFAGYRGMGIATDGVLAVGWSEEPGFGIAVYQVSGGKLLGEWVSDETEEEFGSEILNGPPGLNGTYSIVEAYGDDFGDAYSGTVEIRPNGKLYEVTWSIDDNEYTGVGLLKDDQFMACWGPGAGIVYYEIDGTGLKGIWAVPTDSKLGLETLDRVIGPH